MRSTLVTSLVSLLGLAACDSTDNKDGARGACANGGALAGCPDSEATDLGACWRLVECGYPVQGLDERTFDWGLCMDELGSMIPDRATVVEQCVARSTCDELVAQPGRGEPYCFQFGDT